MEDMTEGGDGSKKALGGGIIRGWVKGSAKHGDGQSGG